jgi:tRNA pseudouridine55 synthase
MAIDKPYGMTSHDVVAEIRRLSGQRDVGHAGTLDPMATGLLMVCLGAATRLSSYLMDGEKWYLATFAFGTQTDTDDALGKPLSVSHGPVDIHELLQALAAQVGPLQQIPPAYAAIKRGGVPAYKSARAGEAVEMGARAVVIHQIVLLRFTVLTAPAVSVEGITTTSQADVLIQCGKGTYVRAMARDAGAAVGCGAHLSRLRRLASGAFTTEDAVSMEVLRSDANAHGATALKRRLYRPDRAVATLPAMVVSESAARDICMGRALAIDGMLELPLIRAYNNLGQFLALCAVDSRNDGDATVQPRKVFAQVGAS